MFCFICTCSFLIVLTIVMEILFRDFMGFFPFLKLDIFKILFLKEKYNFQMEPGMRENLITMKSMVLGSIFGLTVENTREIGRII